MRRRTRRVPLLMAGATKGTGRRAGQVPGHAGEVRAMTHEARWPGCQDPAGAPR